MAGDHGDRLDVVIFGASGFTGERVVRVAIRKQIQLPHLTIGLAGRSTEKLRQVVNRTKQLAGIDELKVTLIEADWSRPETLQRMCAQAKVLINCVGPYRFYGERVVEACVANGTHYVDISGEPAFLEKMQAQYNEEAKNKNLYIVGSCGFDSIPSELGIAFTKRKFPGDLNSVETYMSIGSGPEGVAVHYATWESAVHGVSTGHELGPIRRQIFTQRIPKASLKVDQKAIQNNEDIGGWALPFPGSDRSVARRTEYLEFTEQGRRPVQVISYMKTGTLINTAMFIIFGSLFMLMAKFKITRDLLLKYPKLFSLGMFSHEGPTEQQIKNTTFRMEIVGHGYSEKIAPDAVHTGIPDRKIKVEVTGPEPGYAATSAMVFEAAMTILKEIEQPKSRIPRPGVLPPGYAFGDTDLIESLREHGISFKVVQLSP